MEETKSLFPNEKTTEKQPEEPSLPNVPQSLSTNPTSLPILGKTKEPVKELHISQRPTTLGDTDSLV